MFHAERALSGKKPIVQTVFSRSPQCCFFTAHTTGQLVVRIINVNECISIQRLFNMRIRPIDANIVPSIPSAAGKTMKSNVHVYPRTSIDVFDIQVSSFFLFFFLLS